MNKKTTSPWWLCAKTPCTSLGKVLEKPRYLGNLFPLFLASAPVASLARQNHEYLFDHGFIWVVVFVGGSPTVRNYLGENHQEWGQPGGYKDLKLSPEHNQDTEKKEEEELHSRLNKCKLPIIQRWFGFRLSGWWQIWKCVCGSLHLVASKACTFHNVNKYITSWAPIQIRWSILFSSLSLSFFFFLIK